jgi:hypothetical protein
MDGIEMGQFSACWINLFRSIRNYEYTLATESANRNQYNSNLKVGHRNEKSRLASRFCMMLFWHFSTPFGDINSECPRNMGTSLP